MGARYDIDVTCPKCGREFEAWYAPTSGFMDCTCRCGEVIDLETYTGIDAESTASTPYGAESVRRQKEARPVSQPHLQRAEAEDAYQVTLQGEAMWAAYTRMRAESELVSPFMAFADGWTAGAEYERAHWQPLLEAAQRWDDAKLENDPKKIRDAETELMNSLVAALDRAEGDS